MKILSAAAVCLMIMASAQASAHDAGLVASVDKLPQTTEFKVAMNSLLPHPGEESIKETIGRVCGEIGVICYTGADTDVAAMDMEKQNIQINANAMDHISVDGREMIIYHELGHAVNTPHDNRITQSSETRATLMKYQSGKLSAKNSQALLSLQGLIEEHSPKDIQLRSDLSYKEKGLISLYSQVKMQNEYDADIFAAQRFFCKENKSHDELVSRASAYAASVRGLAGALTFVLEDRILVKGSSGEIKTDPESIATAKNNTADVLVNFESIDHPSAVKRLSAIDRELAMMESSESHRKLSCEAVFKPPRIGLVDKNPTQSF